MSGVPTAADGLALLAQNLSCDIEDCQQDLQALFASTAAFPQGQAMLPVLEMLGAAYQAASVVQPEGPSSAWADFLRQRLAQSTSLPAGLGKACSDVTDHAQTVRHCQRVWCGVQQHRRPLPRGRERYSAMAPHGGDRCAVVTPRASSGAFVRSASTRRATSGARP